MTLAAPPTPGHRKMVAAAGDRPGPPPPRPGAPKPGAWPMPGAPPNGIGGGAGSAAVGAASHSAATGISAAIPFTVSALGVVLVDVDAGELLGAALIAFEPDPGRGQPGDGGVDPVQRPFGEEVEPDQGVQQDQQGAAGGDGGFPVFGEFGLPRFGRGGGDGHGSLPM